ASGPKARQKGRGRALPARNPAPFSGPAGQELRAAHAGQISYSVSFLGGFPPRGVPFNSALSQKNRAGEKQTISPIGNVKMLKNLSIYKARHCSVEKPDVKKFSTALITMTNHDNRGRPSHSSAGTRVGALRRASCHIPCPCNCRNVSRTKERIARLRSRVTRPRRLKSRSDFTARPNSKSLRTMRT